MLLFEFQSFQLFQSFQISVFYTYCGYNVGCTCSRDTIWCHVHSGSTMNFSSYLVEENVFIQNQTVIVNYLIFFFYCFKDSKLRIVIHYISFQTYSLIFWLVVLNLTNFWCSWEGKVNFNICLVVVWQTPYVPTNLQPFLNIR